MKKITLEDGRYEIGIGIGAWAKSVEDKSVTHGTVRVIGGILMCAWNIQPVNWPWQDHEVSWHPVDDSKNMPEDLRAWVQRL